MTPASKTRVWVVKSVNRWRTGLNVFARTSFLTGLVREVCGKALSLVGNIVWFYLISANSTNGRKNSRVTATCKREH